MQIDYEKVRVNEHPFNKNEETDFYVFQWDYVVVP